jgi:hypothetical protein
MFLKGWIGHRFTPFFFLSVITGQKYKKVPNS